MVRHFFYRAQIMVIDFVHFCFFYVLKEKRPLPSMTLRNKLLRLKYVWLITIIEIWFCCVCVFCDFIWNYDYYYYSIHNLLIFWSLKIIQFTKNIYFLKTNGNALLWFFTLSEIWYCKIWINYDELTNWRIDESP